MDGAAVRPSALPRGDSSTSLLAPAELSTNGAGSLSVVPFQLAEFTHFLSRLVPLLLGAEPDDLRNGLFRDAHYGELARRFGVDAACPVVYISKSRLDIDADGPSSISA